MFERNRIDNSVLATAVPVEVTLTDGSVAKGRFTINSGRSVYDVLNGDTQFLDFEDYKGERSLIAKATIAAIRIVPVPSASGLKARLRDGEVFDPYNVLGVGHDASFESIRAAYIALSKTYHPDRFAGATLPAEVGEYLSAMARRINAAYAALEAPKVAVKRAEVERAKPIFTSGQRV